MVEPNEAPAAGSSVGRYVVIEQIGAGGMGQVVRAYDPKLQREVALKQLLTQALDIGGEARLVREARAMAQLHHPNVVSVFDVELDGGMVTISMEFVPGTTLRGWLAQERSWEAIVDVFLQAGRGLIAAHAVGLVHRDFKPTNVLVTEDGRVKVTDFGLAKSAGEHGETAPPEELSDISVHSEDRSARSVENTRTGLVLGTPMYMAPEQHTAEPMDARADQYAYCLALWVALCGAYPFTDVRTERALLKAKREGPPAWPKGVSVPRHVSNAVIRGLAPEPDDRFASMDELVAALSPQLRRSRWVAGVAVGATGAALAIGASSFAVADAEPCAGADERIAQTWGPDARAEVDDAIAAVPLRHAKTTWNSVAPRIDDYARDWAAQHTDACAATKLRSEQSVAMMDLRMACLRRAEVTLGATVHVLRDADETTAARLTTIVGSLPRLDRCADTAALTAGVQPPEGAELAAQVETHRETLARVDALSMAGKYNEARAIGEPLYATTRELGYDPLHAEVTGKLASVLDELGEHEASVERYDEALLTALSSGHHQAAMFSAADLAHVYSAGLRRFEVSKAVATTARGLAERHGDALDQAVVLSMLGGALHSAGDAEAAVEHLERAVELRESAGAEASDVANLHANLGAVLHAAGRYDDAEVHVQQAAQLWSTSIGPEHPRMANLHNTLGVLHVTRGRLDDAVVELRRAIAVNTAALGPEHPDLGMAYNNLGIVLSRMGRYDEAEEAYTQALAIKTAAFGAEHPAVAMSHDNLAQLHVLRGDLEAAEAADRVALEIYDRAVEGDHPDRARVRNRLGHIASVQGRHEEAEALLRASLKEREATLPPEHPDIGRTLLTLGESLERQGRTEDAVPEVERAYALISKAKVSPDVTAQSGFLLGRLLWEAGEDRGRAVALVEDAASSLEGAPGDAPTQRDEMQRWLSEHPRP